MKIKIALILVVLLLTAINFPEAKEGYYLGGAVALENQGGAFTFGVQQQILGALHAREYIESINWGNNLVNTGFMPILYFPFDGIWSGLSLGLHGKIEANVNDIDDFEYGGGFEVLKMFGKFGLSLGIDYHNVNEDIPENPPDYFEFQAGLMVSI